MSVMQHRRDTDVHDARQANVENLKSFTPVHPHGPSRDLGFRVVSRFTRAST
jgi:hypothetical protein